MGLMTTLAAIGTAVGAVAAYDMTQKQHAILRNFPVLGHARYVLESFGPEIRQYFIAANDEERPFTRDQRTWVYASSKRENNLFGFGTDNEVETAPNYLVIKQTTFPWPDGTHGEEPGVPCAKVMGAARGRRKAFRPASVVNTSAMSFGSLSAHAVEALNRGAAMAGCMQNTGEGGIAPHHLHGGDLIWQLGTGYFGARTMDGQLSLDELARKCEMHPVRMIEIKLSQGAKPGKGGVLPGRKVTPEIAEIRGVPVGETVFSPSAHTAFSDADSLLDVVEAIADRTGLPVGIKSAVGQLDFFRELADLMARGDRGVDYIQIDGGEGGTGAAPLAFADHVSLPFKLGFTQVYRLFEERGIADQIVFVGSGKLGFPSQGLLAMALGCDMIGIAREAMMAIGCIQAQKCHTNKCPTGVATQDRWLMRGLDPADKAARFANYVQVLRHDLVALARACGYPHPALVPLDRLAFVDDRFTETPATEVFGYEDGWGLPSKAQRDALMTAIGAH